jgi:hypothetical protein
MTKTPAEKLLIKPGTTAWSSAPDRRDLVGALPAGAHWVDAPQEATTALVFADDAASLRATLAAHAEHVTAPSTFWVAYPKANRTDINRDSVWPILGEHGLRPNGQVAIDDVWSALRFRPLADGEAPFTGRMG